MRVGARAGIGAFHALARARPRELFAGVPGKFGDVGEGYERSLLAAPELGNFALDKESRKLQVGSSGGRVALHDKTLRPRALELSRPPPSFDDQTDQRFSTFEGPQEISSRQGFSSWIWSKYLLHLFYI
jgi:hypothetical protein